MMFEDIITADAGRKFKLCGSRSAAENEYNEYGRMGDRRTSSLS